jgi:hypothetical protein
LRYARRVAGVLIAVEFHVLHDGEVDRSTKSVGELQIEGRAETDGGRPKSASRPLAGTHAPWARSFAGRAAAKSRAGSGGDGAMAGTLTEGCLSRRAGKASTARWRDQDQVHAVFSPQSPTSSIGEDGVDRRSLQRSAQRPQKRLSMLSACDNNLGSVLCKRWFLAPSTRQPRWCLSDMRARQRPESEHTPRSDDYIRRLLVSTSGARIYSVGCPPPEISDKCLRHGQF